VACFFVNKTKKKRNNDDDSFTMSDASKDSDSSKGYELLQAVQKNVRKKR